MDCICALRSDDEAFAFRVGVAVRLACWVCGTHSLVLHPRLRSLPNAVKAEHFFGECLTHAAECHGQALFAREEAARQLLLRLENRWFSLSQCAAVPGGLVAARCMRVGNRTLARPRTGTTASLLGANDERVRFRSGALNGVQP
jgi:hypothetical protein